MKAKVIKLGAKYPGRCAVCGGQTGSRSWELAATLLLRYQDGKYGVAHPACCGAKTKNAVGGGVVLVTAPDEIEVAR